MKIKNSCNDDDDDEQTLGGLNGYVSGILISKIYVPPAKERMMTCLNKFQFLKLIVKFVCLAICEKQNHLDEWHHQHASHKAGTCKQITTQYN